MSDFNDLAKKVSKTVQILAKCSSTDADKAADKICQDPKVLALLAIACGLSVDIASQSLIATKASLAFQAWPTVILGSASTLANGYAAKRFCTAVVKQSGKKITNWDLRFLKDF